MSGIRRLLIGEMGSSSSGEQYVNELNSKLSPESMANCDYDGDMDNSTAPDKQESHKEFYG